MIEFTTSERFLNQWGVGTDLFIGAIHDGDQCIALIARDGLTDEQATENARRVEAALTREAPTEGVRPTWLSDGALIAGWEAKADAYEADSLEADSIGLQIRADRNEAKARILRECANELRARIDQATPPAPQRLAQGDSAVALEVYLSTTWGSAAMRIEALATWLDQQEENCGLLSIAAADLRAMSAKLYSEPTGEGDSWFADALTSMGEVIPLPTQPPRQDRGEVVAALATLDRVHKSVAWERHPYSLLQEWEAARTFITAALTEVKQQDDDGWEANFRYLLDRSPHTLRSREGGGPENLLQSAIITFTRMEPRLEAKQQGPGEVTK